MIKIKDLIKVKYRHQDLVRLGNSGDGGYIASRIGLEVSERLYTYGVGGNWWFEKDYAKMYPNKVVDMFDHTVDVKNTGAVNVIFHKSPLSPTENSTTFDELRCLKTKSLLKLDVEGAEYPFFEKADLATYDNVVSIICEFHYLNNPKILVKFKEIMLRLQKYYDIIHVHGNNFAKLIVEEDFIFPQTPEITFLHKNLSCADNSYSTVDYPLAGLDFPNCGSREDLKFTVFKD